LNKVAAGIEVESPTYVPPGPLSATERQQMDGELLFQKMYGGRVTPPTGIPALDELSKANADAELRKLLGPGRRAQSELDKMIERAVSEAFGELKKRHVPSEHDREPLQIRTGGRIEYDASFNESTEYDATSGALLRSWAGPPSARPAFEVMVAAR